jgi:hypothetical protein
LRINTTHVTFRRRSRILTRHPFSSTVPINFLEYEGADESRKLSAASVLQHSVVEVNLITDFFIRDNFVYVECTTRRKKIQYSMV